MRRWFPSSVMGSTGGFGMFSHPTKWTARYIHAESSTLPKWGCWGCGLLCHQDSVPPGELRNVNVVERNLPSCVLSAGWWPETGFHCSCSDPLNRGTGWADFQMGASTCVRAQSSFCTEALLRQPQALWWVWYHPSSGLSNDKLTLTFTTSPVAKHSPLTSPFSLYIVSKLSGNPIGVSSKTHLTSFDSSACLSYTTLEALAQGQG